MFLVIFLVGGLGVYYLNMMADESRHSDEVAKNLSDKINTLEQKFYDVEQSIDERYNEQIGGYILTIDTLAYRQNLLEFGENFKLVGGLLKTERSLKDNYRKIAFNMDRLLAEGSEDSLIYNIKTVVPAIERIKVELEGLALANARFIQRSNLKGAETADKVINYMLVSGGLAILVGLVILFGFPSYIGKPLEEVTDAISDFRNKRYDRRILIRKNDEFGLLANAFNQMAEQIETYESEQRTKLAAEESKSEIILNSLREAVLITDSQKNVVFVNSTLEALLNKDREELVGRYSADLALEYILIRDMLKNSNQKNQQPSFISFEEDGKKKYFEKEVLEIKLPEHLSLGEGEDSSKGKVVILKDITDFQQKDIAKTNLISTISHELKTPISSIKMSAQLLSDIRIGKYNDEQASLVEDIKGDCERLLRITKELVDMSQLESGKINISISDVDARDFIKKAIDSVKFQSEVKEIDIRYDVSKGPVMVKADMEKSNLIMVNLLTNAIKYSYVDSVIEIETKDRGDKYEFVVRDYGEGIEAEHKDKIFGRYYQIEKNSYDVKKTGTGLGLAICKDFVNEQNGEIWVVSEPGKGSEFHFTLPKEQENGKSDLTVDDVLEENRRRSEGI